MIFGRELQDVGVTWQWLQTDGETITAAMFTGEICPALHCASKYSDCGFEQGAVRKAIGEDKYQLILALRADRSRADPPEPQLEPLPPKFDLERYKRGGVPFVKNVKNIRMKSIPAKYSSSNVSIRFDPVSEGSTAEQIRDGLAKAFQSITPQSSPGLAQFSVRVLDNVPCPACIDSKLKRRRKCTVCQGTGLQMLRAEEIQLYKGFELPEGDADPRMKALNRSFATAAVLLFRAGHTPEATNCVQQLAQVRKEAMQVMAEQLAYEKELEAYADDDEDV